MKQYTISETAKMLNVSRQTVYNKIDSEDLQPYLQDSEKGKTISEKGFHVLKNMLGSTSNGQSKGVNDGQYIDRLIDSLKAENTKLYSVISDQLKQIENLTKLIENSQILLKQEQDRSKMLLESAEAKEKRWFWGLFNK
jgi:predicted DNA-binding protein YlxM (UPF0122 family)